MARISNSLVSVREQVAYNKFLEGASIEQVQEILKTDDCCQLVLPDGSKRGISMATKRIKQLYDAAKAGEPIPPTNKVVKKVKVENVAETSEVTAESGAETPQVVTAEIVPPAEAQSESMAPIDVPVDVAPVDTEIAAAL